MGVFGIIGEMIADAFRGDEINVGDYIKISSDAQYRYSVYDGSTIKISDSERQKVWKVINCDNDLKLTLEAVGGSGLKIKI